MSGWISRSVNICKSRAPLARLVPVAICAVGFGLCLAPQRLPAEEPRQAGRRDTGTSLQAATSLQEVAERLTQIADAAAKRERQFANLHVKAHIEPRGERYDMAVQNGRGRLDLHFTKRPSAGTTTYWLDDGVAFYSSSRNTLVIDPPLAQRERMPAWLSSRLALFFGVAWNGEVLTVSQFCRELASTIRGNEIDTEHWTTRVVEGSPLRIVVEGKMTEPPHNAFTEVTLDPARGFLMTDFIERQSGGRTPRDYVSHRRITSEYSELAPGVFFLSRGVWTQREAGTLAEVDNRAEDSKAELTIDSVEYGDFELPANYFDAHHWPGIRKGLQVIDHRTKPSLRFEYGDSPYDPMVLD
ncbi:hypothetical protein Pla123a_27290 [Posidoniimonas polymericola]|uniref:Uncharacterized protein n=1 Tax=Posidoniimonas polymericola TaxID=2528002 RepID=A0A5C5YM00_9BACT|nr:hypothetical protein [Posidoniimonas polymericola]TWT75944.1 hypothetical protein Pla123a_27290 [Posidoniimonas polymericola]